MQLCTRRLLAREQRRTREDETEEQGPAEGARGRCVERDTLRLSVADHWIGVVERVYNRPRSPWACVLARSGEGLKGSALHPNGSANGRPPMRRPVVARRRSAPRVGRTMVQTKAPPHIYRCTSLIACLSEYGNTVYCSTSAFFVRVPGAWWCTTLFTSFSFTVTAHGRRARGVGHFTARSSSASLGSLIKRSGQPNTSGRIVLHVSCTVECHALQNILGFVLRARLPRRSQRFYALTT
jgi:hypothetical protein